MKKIDILNYITNFRQAPNDIKTKSDILAHLGAANEAEMNAMLEELKSLKVIKELEADGQKAYQVMKK